MNDVDRSGRARQPSAPRLARLLRAAALAKDDAPLEAPFGFDTRVVALWRERTGAESVGLAQLLRRITLVAIAISVLTATGAYFEAKASREHREPFTNEFAIVDSEIESEFPQ
jgi:hypothetical protein